MFSFCGNILQLHNDVLTYFNKYNFNSMYNIMFYFIDLKTLKVTSHNKSLNKMCASYMYTSTTCGQ